MTFNNKKVCASTIDFSNILYLETFAFVRAVVQMAVQVAVQVAGK